MVKESSRLAFVLGAVALLFLTASPVAAWQIVEGLVTESSGTPLAGVEIRVDGCALRATPTAGCHSWATVTGSDGRYRVDLAAQLQASGAPLPERGALIFAKPGHTTHVEHLQRRRGAQKLDVMLGPATPSVSVETAVPRARWILVVHEPDIGAGTPAGDAARMIAYGTARGITRNIASLTLAQSPPETAIRVIPFDSESNVVAVALRDPGHLAALRVELRSVETRPRPSHELALTMAVPAHGGAPGMVHRWSENTEAVAAGGEAILRRALAPATRIAIVILAQQAIAQALAANDAVRLRAVQQLAAHEARRIAEDDRTMATGLLALQLRAEEALQRMGQR
jgi:hypothetical protein